MNRVVIFSLFFFSVNGLFAQDVNGLIELEFESGIYDINSTNKKSLDSLAQLLWSDSFIVDSCRVVVHSLQAKEEYSSDRFIGVRRSRNIIDYLIDTHGFSNDLFLIQDSIHYELSDQRMGFVAFYLIKK